MNRRSPVQTSEVSDSAIARNDTLDNLFPIPIAGAVQSDLGLDALKSASVKETKSRFLKAGAGENGKEHEENVRTFSLAKKTSSHATLY